LILSLLLPNQVVGFLRLIFNVQMNEVVDFSKLKWLVFQLTKTPNFQFGPGVWNTTCLTAILILLFVCDGAVARRIDLFSGLGVLAPNAAFNQFNFGKSRRIPSWRSQVRCNLGWGRYYLLNT